jgi:signal transduction histidine kinase
MTNQELLAQAKQLKKENPQKAIDVLREIDLKSAEEAGFVSQVYCEFVKNYLNLGDFDKVEEYLSEIEKIIPTDNDPKLRLFATEMKGILNIEKGNYKAGIDYFQEAFELAKLTKDMNLLYNETMNIAVVFNNLKKFDKALEYMLYAEKLASQHNFDKSHLLNNLCACYGDAGYLEKAIEKGIELEGYLIELGNKVLLVPCYLNLGNTYGVSGDYGKALEYLNKAEELASITNQSERFYELKFHKAVALTELSRTEEAIPLLEYALDRAVFHGKVENQARYLTALAHCYSIIGDYKNAYEKLEASNTISEKINDDSTNDKIARYQAKLEVEHKLNEKEQLMMIYARQAEMGQMIAAIAHQWRQPITALSIILDSIYDAWEFGELDDKSLQTKITSGKELISSMNNTIRDFRSFFQEKQEYEIFNVREVIEKAVRFTDYRFRQEDIKLEFQVKDNCLLPGSSNQLLQALLIIINNSFDAFLGVKHHAPYVSILHKKEFNTSVIRIADNAGGIPENLIDKIFQLNFSTKKTEDNSGIGLYLAKMIIEVKFKGFISVKNSNNGAVFTIEIPLPPEKG